MSDVTVTHPVQVLVHGGEVVGAHEALRAHAARGRDR